jgi:hypothetical protein
MTRLLEKWRSGCEYKKGIDALFSRWRKAVDVDGDCVQK